MPSTLMSKLQLKPGQALTVLNAPTGYLERLAASLDTILSTQADQAVGAVLVFVWNMAEAAQWMPVGIRTVTPDGLLWVAYPKGTSGIKTDINRDRLWEATATTGWRPVRQVALDEVWSAMRFRPADQVNSGPKS